MTKNRYSDTFRNNKMTSQRWVECNKTKRTDIDSSSEPYKHLPNYDRHNMSKKMEHILHFKPLIHETSSYYNANMFSPKPFP